MKLPSNKTLGIMLVLIACLPISRAASIYNARQAFIATSDEREGTVVALQPVTDTGSNTSNKQLLAVVEYLDDSGALQRAPSNVASYPAPQAIGDIVTLRISQQDDTDVRIVSFAGLWFESLFFLIPGLIALSAGLFMIWRSRK